MTDYFPDTIELRDAGMRGDSRCFRLTHYFRYVSSYGVITVPAGFITDGASVPRLFWNVFQPFGPYFPAALIHDWLYARCSTERYIFERWEADYIFKEAMYNIGIGWPTRETIYRAVRLFGGSSYKRFLP